MIKVESVTKEYRILQSQNGLKDLLHPKYRLVKAIDNISFEIQTGEVVGIIGPNGAGKSTLIKMLTAILTPSTGLISIDGGCIHDHRKEYLKSIGVMFGQKTQLWWDLPLRDSFHLLKAMYNIDDSQYRENMKLFDKMLSIESFLDQPVRQLSLGQRVRGDLAAALLHNPKIIFLDEPTIGLDFFVKKRVRACLKEIVQKRHMTMIITSHDIGDIEQLCDRVLIIDKGSIVFDGSLLAIKSLYGNKKRIRITFAYEYPDFELKNTELIYASELTKEFAFLANETPTEIINRIDKQYEITNIEVLDATLEDIIAEIYSGKVREKLF